MGEHPLSFPISIFVMIEVDNFSKTYAGFRAVQGISFHVSKGEIVGFLGPNGAGKSTTMKVLAGYLPPTDGQIKVGGFDVVTDSIEVRKRIGYMPENVPLYTDMRVVEFLRFRAELKKVPRRKIKERVAIRARPLPASPTCSRRSSARFPRATASAWAWPMRWSTIHSCSSSMSRPSDSIQTRFAPCAT